MIPSTTWRQMGVLILVGAGLGIGYNVVSPNPIPWKGEKVKTVPLEMPGGAEAEPPSATESPGEFAGDRASTPPAREPDAAAVGETTPGDEPATGKAPPAADYSDIPESEFPIEITLAQAKTFYDRGGLVVLDARELEEYTEGHIAGAVAAPYDDVSGDLEWLTEYAGRSEPLMVYCGGGDCELSINLGFAITQEGHRRVLVLKDGYPAWEEAGHPVETGEMP